MGRFDGRVALVTGGASGIGAATARRLVAEGARVMVGDIDLLRGAELAETLGDAAAFEGVDVTQLSEVEALVGATAERFGALHVLINNAGVGAFGKTPEVDPEAWRRVIDVDLNSVFYGCRAAIPLLRASGGGAIVNTASISGLGGDYGFQAYNAAKGAVVNYTRTLALDHGREGIRVNAVCPGPIDTALFAPLKALDAVVAAYEERVPLGRVGGADEVAAAVAFLASDDASYITGAMLTVDGGITAHTGQPDFARILGISSA